MTCTTDKGPSRTRRPREGLWIRGRWGEVKGSIRVSPHQGLKRGGDRTRWVGRTGVGGSRMREVTEPFLRGSISGCPWDRDCIPPHLCVYGGPVLGCWGKGRRVRGLFSPGLWRSSRGRGPSNIGKVETEVCVFPSTGSGRGPPTRTHVTPSPAGPWGHARGEG